MEDGYANDHQNNHCTLSIKTPINILIIIIIIIIINNNNNNNNNNK